MKYLNKGNKKKIMLALFNFQGHTEAIGNYHQLVNSGIDFASLLSTGHEEESSSPAKQVTHMSEKKNRLIPLGHLQDSEKCKIIPVLSVFHCGILLNE